MAQDKSGGKELNAEAIKLLDELDALFDRAVYEAREKTAILRNFTDHVPEGTLRCFRCDCEMFMTGTGGPGGLGRCRRAGCGHSFFSHDVG